MLESCILECSVANFQSQDDGHPLSLINFASVYLGFSQELQACHGYHENQNQGMFESKKNPVKGEGQKNPDGFHPSCFPKLSHPKMNKTSQDQ